MEFRSYHDRSNVTSFVSLLENGPMWSNAMMTAAASNLYVPPSRARPNWVAALA